MAKRDPQARRAAIVRAACDLIVEVGPSKITHRLVADRAQVPLGSTTAYFDTIDDLRAEALEELSREIDAMIDQLREEFARDPESAPDRLIDTVHEHLSDRRNVIADTALMATAVYDQQVNKIARQWSVDLVEVLGEYIGAENAKAITYLIDGATANAAVTGEVVDKATLRRILNPFVPSRGV